MGFIRQNSGTYEVLKCSGMLSSPFPLRLCRVMHVKNILKLGEGLYDRNVSNEKCVKMKKWHYYIILYFYGFHCLIVWHDTVSH